MSNKLVVGITGNTGAGKSTVSGLFREYGYKILDADKISKEVIDSNQDCINSIAEFFGLDILNSDGSINRKKLSFKAFESESTLFHLGEITHGYILKRLEDIILSVNLVNIVIDAAALIQSGAVNLCDFVITVETPRLIRLERIIKRDGLSYYEAIKRINAQPEERFYRNKSDYILYGNKDIHILKNDIRNLCQDFGGAECQK